jgi:hypothetical protein
MAVERVGPAARHARLAERQEHLAVQAELVDDLSLSARRVDAVVGRPHVAVLVDVEAVGKVEYPGAKAAEELAGRRSGGSVSLSSPRCPPHTGRAQMLLSGAMSMPAVDPHLRPSGSCPKLTPGWNGFASLLVGA